MLERTLAITGRRHSGQSLVKMDVWNDSADGMLICSGIDTELSRLIR